MGDQYKITVSGKGSVVAAGPNAIATFGLSEEQLEKTLKLRKDVPGTYTRPDSYEIHAIDGGLASVGYNPIIVDGGKRLNRGNCPDNTTAHTNQRSDSESTEEDTNHSVGSGLNNIHPEQDETTESTEDDTHSENEFVERTDVVPLQETEEQPSKSETTDVISLEETEEKPCKSEANIEKSDAIPRQETEENLSESDSNFETSQKRLAWYGGALAAVGLGIATLFVIKKNF